MVARCLELAEEAEVVFDEVADVGDAVEDHGEAVEAEAEGEAGDFGGVEEGVFACLANGFEDGGVDHAAAGDFDPAILFAFGFEFDVDLEAGFGEGEEVGAEADGGFGAEDFAKEVFEGALQVGEGDVFVDVEAFELIEDGEMGSVDLVAAVSGAGGDDADGELFDGFHGADLHAGSVGAEKAAVVEVEGVALVAGGVVGGGVEGVEAVPFGFDFGAFGEGEAHAAEGGDGEVADLCEGVQGAGALAGATGEGDVESGDGSGVFGGLESELAGGDAVGDGSADFVEFGANVFFDVRGDVLHTGAEGGEFAFLAEVVDAEGFESGLVGGGVEGGEGFGVEGGEVGEHRRTFLDRINRAFGGRKDSLGSGSCADKKTAGALGPRLWFELEFPWLEPGFRRPWLGKPFGRGLLWLWRSRFRQRLHR